MKKLLYFLFGAGLMVAGTAYAVQISVPSAPAVNYLLESLGVGSYQATTSIIVSGKATLATTTASDFNKIIYVDGVHYAFTSAGVNQAIKDISAEYGGGKVMLPATTFTWNSRVTPKNNVCVQGAGKGATILQGSVANDYDFYYSGSTPLLNFCITDLTIDLQNGTNASGIRFNEASSTEVSRVAFTNGAAGGWEMLLGSPTSATDPVVNYNNKFVDDDFQNHAGTLEAFLVFNAQNTQIIRPTLSNITSPGIGLWQKTYDTVIDGLHCYNSTGQAIYYSITVDRTVINNPTFENCSTGVQGSNISDNGAFGLTQANSLQINHPLFYGGSNSINATAIQLGGVVGAVVEGGIIENYQIGVGINNGNNSNTGSSTNWAIHGTVFKNNNASANFHVLHAAIMITGSTAGCLNGSITDNKFYNENGTNQKYPIGFDGAQTWDCITIANNRLTAATTTGGTSISLADSAALGTHVDIHGNQDYSGTSPAQALSFFNSNVGIATTSPGSLFSINGIANFTTATTTFYGNGLNIPSNQCYAIGGTCLTSFSNTLASGGTATTTFYSGGVVFSDGTMLTQAAGNGNKQFFWDDTNSRFGLGTSSPVNTVDIEATGGSTLRIADSGANANSQIQLFRNNTQIGGVGTFNSILTLWAGTESNTNGVVIKSGPLMGIGTTSPLSALVVSGGASIGANYNFAAPSNGLIVQGLVGIGTSSPYAALSVVGSTGVVADHYNATSTTASSTFQGLTATAIADSALTSGNCLKAGTGGQILDTGSGCSSGTVTSITLGGGLDGASPITTTGTIIAQIGTSTVPSIGGLAYWTGAATPSTLGTVATSSETCTYPVVCGAHNVLAGGGAITFNGLATSSPFSNNQFVYTSNTGTLVTAASSSFFGYTPLNPTRQILTTFPLAGGGDLSADRTLTFGGLTTSTAATIGNIPYFSGVNTFANVATSTVTCSSPLSCTGHTVIGSSDAISLGTVGLANGGTATTTFYSGGVVFSDGSKLTQAAANTSFFWDNTNKRIGLGTISPQSQIHISDGSSAAIRLEKTGSLAGTAQIYNDGNFNLVGPGSSPNRRFAFYDQMGAAAGTVALPPFTDFNNVDTGMFFPDDVGSIGWTVNGAEAARLTTVGVFGIGTTTPVGGLTVASTTGPQIALSDGLGSNLWTMRNISGTYYLATSTYTATSTTAAFSVNTNGQPIFASIAAASGNNCLQVDTTGKLSSTGSACAGSFAYPFPANATTTGLGLYASTTIGAGGQATGLTISGGATTTGNATFGDGLAATPSMAFGSQINTGFFKAGTSIIGVSTNGTNNWQFDSGPFYSANAAGPRFNNLTGVSATAPVIIPDRGAATTGFAAGTAGNINAIVGAAELMRWTGSGVGIGTTSPFALLSIHASSTATFVNNMLFAIGSSTASATTTHFYVTNTGAIFAPNTASSGGAQTGYWCYDANGQLIRDTVVCIAVSAKRFKQDIQPLQVGLNELLQLNPISFKWKADYNKGFENNPNYNGTQYSLIADDVQKIDPNLVSVETATTTYEGVTYPPGTVAGLASYNNWIGLFTQSIKDLNAKIDGKAIVVKAARSAEENWQDGLISLLVLGFIYQQWQIRKLKK